MGATMYVSPKRLRASSTSRGTHLGISSSSCLTAFSLSHCSDDVDDKVTVSFYNHMLFQGRYLPLIHRTRFWPLVQLHAQQNHPLRQHEASISHGEKSFD